MDLIQSEYGWSDSVVLDLPICRLRQIVANIEHRARDRRIYSKTITEWQTRTLAQFIAATVPIDKGKKNPLAEAADRIELKLGDEGAKTVLDANDPAVFIEQGSQVAENRVGSTERLMRGFG